MTREIKTLELARVYENQGYYQEALGIYTYLADYQPSREVESALSRLEGKMKTPVELLKPEKKISNLLEKWMMLVVLRQRLDNFNKIKSCWV